MRWAAVSDPFACVATVRLLPGRDAAVRRRHPWVYRGAIAGPIPTGDGPVRVAASDGVLLGVALRGGSGGSLALRMVAFGEQAWSATTLRERLLDAHRLRVALDLAADAYRLVHAEGDALPGLVIDRYLDVAVCELYEPAWEPFLPAMRQTLVAELGFASVLVRRAWRRGVPIECVHGTSPPAPLVVREGSVRMLADLLHGQKTGLFLDQRENRRRVGALARGKTVLNLFAYSGGFGLAALAGGANRAINVDTSGAALELARENWALNGLPIREEDFILGDAFAVTRDLVAAGERFGVVVVDPPAFVRRKSELAGGLRGYKDINLQALRLVSPGGLLLTCSCSALVSEVQFAQTLAWAAADSGRSVRVLERRGAGADHPVSVFCPEAAHLKAFLCHVV